jgi:chromosome segregation ATPase
MDTRADIGADARADMSRAISVLDAAVATLRQELAHGSARIGQVEQARDQLGKLWETSEAARARAEAEVTALRVRLDRAEASREAERIRADRVEAENAARKARGLAALLRAAWRGE